MLWNLEVCCGIQVLFNSPSFSGYGKFVIWIKYMTSDLWQDHFNIILSSTQRYPKPVVFPLQNFGLTFLKLPSSHPIRAACVPQHPGTYRNICILRRSRCALCGGHVASLLMGSNAFPSTLFSYTLCSCIVRGHIYHQQEVNKSILSKFFLWTHPLRPPSTLSKCQNLKFILIV